MAWIDIERLSFAYPGQAPVVDGVSWQMAQGAFHCLLGRSGCGKTSLLQLLAGLLEPQAGRIVRAGGSLAAPGPQLGVMFQSPTLLDWLTVLDNVLLPLSLQRKPTAQDRHAAEQLLAQLGLAALARQQPGQLSGGQQSRVALARALMREPPLLLLDEPFAALDAMTRQVLQDELLQIYEKSKKTIIFITHSIDEALLLSTRMLIMSARPGRVVTDIRNDLPMPRNAQVQLSPRYNELKGQIWDTVQSEVMRSLQATSH